jgi:hypothetical protein
MEKIPSCESFAITCSSPSQAWLADYFILYRTSVMGTAFVTGLQKGSRRNTSSTAVARMAATCKHFAAFGSPQGGLNLAPVAGGERELRTTYLKPFQKACAEAGALSIMTAYSSYDGIPAISNTRETDFMTSVSVPDSQQI